MAEETKKGKTLIIGAIAASVVVAGLGIREVVDELDAVATREKIDCGDNGMCRMLWRAPTNQCAALTECDGCDKSVVRLGGGPCAGDENYVEPETGHEVARLLHCAERGGLISGWHAWYPEDTYLEGVQLRDPTCAVDIVLPRESLVKLSEAIDSQSAVLVSAKFEEAPEWAKKSGQRAHSFAGEKRRVAK